MPAEVRTDEGARRSTLHADKGKNQATMLHLSLSSHFVTYRPEYRSAITRTRSASR